MLIGNKFWGSLGRNGNTRKLVTVPGPAECLGVKKKNRLEGLGQIA